MAKGQAQQAEVQPALPTPTAHRPPPQTPPAPAHRPPCALAQPPRPSPPAAPSRAPSLSAFCVCAFSQ